MQDPQSHVVELSGTNDKRRRLKVVQDLGLHRHSLSHIQSYFSIGSPPGGPFPQTETQLGYIPTAPTGNTPYSGKFTGHNVLLLTWAPSSP